MCRLKECRTRVAVGLVALAALVHNSANADELTLSSYEGRIAELERLVLQPKPAACCPCFPSGVVGAAEMVFLKPHFERNAALQTRTGVAAADDRVSVPFTYDHEITPRIWLGYVNEQGIGLRTRYWEFDHNADNVSALSQAAPNLVESIIESPHFGLLLLNPAVGNTLQSTSSLEARAIDLEGTFMRRAGQTLVTTAGGIRYGELRQSYLSRSFTAGGAVDELQARLHNFYGIGPTVAVDVRRPLGGSSLSVTGGLRASYLFGDDHLQEVEFDDGLTDRDSYSATHDGALPILELSLGLDWSTPLSSGGRFFVRGSWEAQAWIDAGSSMTSEGTLGLNGFALGAGVTR